MVTVGLTGGIASGKSVIASYLHKLGFPIIDADKIGHTIQEPGRPAHEEIVRTFGGEVLNEDGTINRGRLGAMVFGDERKLSTLAAITHPRIFEEQARLLHEAETENPDAVVIMEVALLIEAGVWESMDYVMVAYCGREQQKQRLMERSGLDEEAAEMRLKAQWDLERKVGYADFLVDTSGSIGWTVEQLDRLYPVLAGLGLEEEDEP